MNLANYLRTKGEILEQIDKLKGNPAGYHSTNLTSYKWSCRYRITQLPVKGKSCLTSLLGKEEQKQEVNIEIYQGSVLFL